MIIPVQEQQSNQVLSTSQLLPNTSFMTSQPRFVTSSGAPAQAVLVKTADGKTLLATTAHGQLVRHIRPVTVQNFQPQHQQQQQQPQHQAVITLPTTPFPSLKMSPMSQSIVIPTSSTESGGQQQQVFRVPVSTAAGAVFVDASKQTHTIPQAVLVTFLDFSSPLNRML